MERKSKYPPGEPCKCHGVPKFWNKDKRNPAGGYWRCVVKVCDNARLAQRTPGTYRFKEARGIGIAGAKGYLRRRKRERASVESEDRATVSRILAEYPDLRELVQ